MSPEFELVVLSARSGVGSDGLARARALLDQVSEPARLRAVARRHGLGPLLAIFLRRLQEGEQPSEVEGASLGRFGEVAAALRDELRQSTVRGLLAGREACEITGWLNEAGIEVLVLKGPALGGYYACGLRDYCDIDLLVKPERVVAARAVLVGRAYRQTSGPPEEFLSRCLGYGAELGLERRRRMPIDLHWSLSDAAYAFALPLGRTWGRAETIEVGGGSIRTLGSSELLVYLCFHGAKHLWSRLLWLADVARLVEQGSLDWDDVEGLARATHTRRLVALGLSLARDLLACRLPEGAARLAAPTPEVADLASEVCARLETGWTDLARHRFLLRALDRRRDRLGYLRDMAFRPGVDDWSLVRLPERLFPLYTGVRVLRLAGKYGGLVLRGQW